MNNLELIKKISDNLEAITILDFISDDPKIIKEFDANCETILGTTISHKSEFYPWIPIQYVHAISQLDKTKNIPKGIEFIQFISVKHIGVANEIVCYCKIDKREIQEEAEIQFKKDLKKDISGQLFSRMKSGIDLLIVEKKIDEILDGFFETYEIDLNAFHSDFKELNPLIDDTIFKKDSNQLIIDFLNSKFNFLSYLQFEVEKYLKDIIPGIFLSNFVDNSREMNCISTFIYDISNLDSAIVQKAKNGTLNIEQAYQWIGSFDYDSKFVDMDYSGNKLSLLGLDHNPSGQQILSLIDQNFIMGYGSKYKVSKLGSYKNRFIIFRLKEEHKINYSGKIGYENILIDLSKFLLPTHWIRFRFEAVEKLNSKVKGEVPSIRHDKNTNKLSRDLEDILTIYDKENADKAINIDLFAKIQDELKCLDSLKSELLGFIGEIKEDGFKSLSGALYIDIDFWNERIREEIKAVQLKEDLRLQHMQNNVNVTTSFINNKLQNSVKRLTIIVVGLTIILTWFTVKNEIMAVIYWIWNFVQTQILLMDLS